MIDCTIEVQPGFLTSDEAARDTSPDRREQQEQKYWERLNACIHKTINIGENPLNGDCHHVFARCGCVDCSFCGPFEINKRIKEIKEAMETKGPMRILEGITKQEQQKLMRKYKSAKVESIPIQDGDNVTFTLVIETTDEIGEAYTGPTEEQIRQWLSPTYGHNKSGKLFDKPKPPKTPKAEESQLEPEALIEMEMQQVDFSACNETMEYHGSHEWWAQLVIDMAIWQTHNLLPTDQFTLERALKERRQARQNIIEKLGGVVIRVEGRKKYIKLNNIDWNPTLSRVEKRKDELEKWLLLIEKKDL